MNSELHSDRLTWAVTDRFTKPEEMDASAAKRRKTEHSNGTLFESAVIPGTQRATPFVMETDELLKEVKPDYGKQFEGADQLLHKLKQSIEEIQPHGPIPVSNYQFSVPDTLRLILL